LLAEDGGGGGGLRLVDWGFGIFLPPGARARGLAGTSFYVAPEVLRGGHDARADVWSAGVVLYVMLVGRYPFDAPDPAKKDAGMAQVGAAASPSGRGRSPWLRAWPMQTCGEHDVYAVMAA
jgi:serine/threonine protein kinase